MGSDLPSPAVVGHRGLHVWSDRYEAKIAERGQIRPEGTPWIPGRQLLGTRYSATTGAMSAG